MPLGALHGPQQEGRTTPALTWSDGLPQGCPVQKASLREGDVPVVHAPLPQTAMPWRSPDSKHLLQCVIWPAVHPHSLAATLCEQLMCHDSRQALQAAVKSSSA